MAPEEKNMIEAISNVKGPNTNSIDIPLWATNWFEIGEQLPQKWKGVEIRHTSVWKKGKIKV